jgi:hypothetical protein
LAEIKEEIKDFDSPPQKVNKKVMVDAETQTDKSLAQPSKIKDRFTQARQSDSSKKELTQSYQNTNQPIIIAARDVNLF